MAQRIYIKVFGFSDEERHTLNTVFRLSEGCRVMYQLWTPQAPETHRVALLDGQSWEARVEAESPLRADVKLLWVGSNAPASVWRSFARPIVWPDIIASLDILFSPEAGIDVELGDAHEAEMSARRALIVSADRNERLYLRARLALARMTCADEAESADQALQLARRKQYDLALLDSGLRDMDAWELLRQLRAGNHPVNHIAMTKVVRTVPERMRAKVRGAMLLEHPPHPGRLDAWLSRVELGTAG
ncbi:MAG TPA: response regulator [Ramlibacter sp.]|jgi:CheY-like chemotaxis protein|nr:response regulator [Ramlibacter sp.]